MARTSKQKQGLDGLDAKKRETLKRLGLGAAFVVPVITSVALDGLTISKVQAAAPAGSDVRKRKKLNEMKPTCPTEEALPGPGESCRVECGCANEVACVDDICPAPSDIRLKEDITLLMRFDNGINLYRYRYKWSDQLYVGVMAQEVAKVVPTAVLRGKDGYLRVDYEQLGMKLMTWDEWTAQTSSLAA